MIAVATCVSLSLVVLLCRWVWHNVPIKGMTLAEREVAKCTGEVSVLWLAMTREAREARGNGSPASAKVLFERAVANGAPTKCSMCGYPLRVNSDDQYWFPSAERHPEVLGVICPRYFSSNRSDGARVCYGYNFQSGVQLVEGEEPAWFKNALSVGP